MAAPEWDWGEPKKKIWYGFSDFNYELTEYDIISIDQEEKKYFVNIIIDKTLETNDYNDGSYSILTFDPTKIDYYDEWVGLVRCYESKEEANKELKHFLTEEIKKLEKKLLPLQAKLKKLC